MNVCTVSEWVNRCSLNVQCVRDHIPPTNARTQHSPMSCRRPGSERQSSGNLHSPNCCLADGEDWEIRGRGKGEGHWQSCSAPFISFWFDTHFSLFQKEIKQTFLASLCSSETLKLFPTGPQNYQISTEEEKQEVLSSSCHKPGGPLGTALSMRGLLCHLSNYTAFHKLPTASSRLHCHWKRWPGTRRASAYWCRWVGPGVLFQQWLLLVLSRPGLKGMLSFSRGTPWRALKELASGHRGSRAERWEAGSCTLSHQDAGLPTEAPRATLSPVSGAFMLAAALSSKCASLIPSPKPFQPRPVVPAKMPLPPGSLPWPWDFCQNTGVVEGVGIGIPGPGVVPTATTS